MLTKNMISASITAADVAAAKQRLLDLIAQFPFLISLTPAQRIGGLKLGDKTVSFVDKIIAYSNANPDFVPPYLDMAEFAKDYQLMKDLLEILRILRPFARDMEDTTTEARVEALSAAMVLYNSVKGAAKQGVPGAKAIYEDLQQRFPGAGGSNYTPALPENNP